MLNGWCSAHAHAYGRRWGLHVQMGMVGRWGLHVQMGMVGGWSLHVQMGMVGRWGLHVQMGMVGGPLHTINSTNCAVLSSCGHLRWHVQTYSEQQNNVWAGYIAMVKMGK